MENTNRIRDVILYSDGSCLKNPGSGGWACILVCKTDTGEYEKEFYGAEEHTTNNRMEIIGVLVGLSKLKYRCNVTVVTDSQYVVNSFNKGWIYSWEKQGFRDRLNSDLWIELLKLVRLHNVTFQWIKGHAGHPQNERCDKLARNAAIKISSTY